MDIRHIGKDACPVSSWSGGTTTELFLSPENGSYQNRDFLWRLSSAVVDLEESTFTLLPEFNRIIMTLEGEMDLSHNGGPWIHLKEFTPHSFDGTDTTVSRGRVTDFNLMLKKGACSGALTVVSGSGERTVTEKAGVWFFYCHDGGIRLSVSGISGAKVCGAGEGLLIRDALPGSQISWETGPGARVILAEIRQ